MASDIPRTAQADWKRARKEVLERDQHECQQCGATDASHVHHKTPVSEGGSDDLENLITLCAECHIDLHYDEKSSYIGLTAVRELVQQLWTPVFTHGILRGKAPGNVRRRRLNHLAERGVIQKWRDRPVFESGVYEGEQGSPKPFYARPSVDPTDVQIRATPTRDPCDVSVRLDAIVGEERFGGINRSVFGTE